MREKQKNVVYSEMLEAMLAKADQAEVEFGSKAEFVQVSRQCQLVDLKIE